MKPSFKAIIIDALYDASKRGKCSILQPQRNIRIISDVIRSNGEFNVEISVGLGSYWNVIRQLSSDNIDAVAKAAAVFTERVTPVYRGLNFALAPDSIYRKGFLNNETIYREDPVGWAYALEGEKLDPVYIDVRVKSDHILNIIVKEGFRESSTILGQFEAFNSERLICDLAAFIGSLEK